jgi:hypothetical protein
MYKLRKGDDIRNNERVRRREKKNIPEESIRGPYRLKEREEAGIARPVLDRVTGYFAADA